MLNTAIRTLGNTFLVGVIASISIFAVYTLKASGERMIESLATDIETLGFGHEKKAA